MLLDYIEKNKDTIHPALLLEVCKYFRISVNAETKAVLDFISNARLGLPVIKTPVPADLVRQIDELPEDKKGTILSAITAE